MVIDWQRSGQACDTHGSLVQSADLIVLRDFTDFDLVGAFANAPQFRAAQSEVNTQLLFEVNGDCSVDTEILVLNATAANFSQLDFA